MQSILDSNRSILSSYLWEKEFPCPEELTLFKKTQKYVRFISWVPWIRMVAVVNTLAMYSSSKESDIDLFIVTDPGRMWVVRLFVTFIYQILGVRRYKEYVAGRFCLSFFATTDAINMEDIAIEKDIYLAHWCETIKPILDIWNTYDLFCKSNAWVYISDDQKIENRRFLEIHREKKEEWFPSIWNFLEKKFQDIFKPRTLGKNARIGNPWWIIISDHMLKFHRNDKRKVIREELIK